MSCGLKSGGLMSGGLKSYDPGPVRKLNYEARARPGPQKVCPGPAAKQLSHLRPRSGRAIGLTTCPQNSNIIIVYAL